MQIIFKYYLFYIYIYTERIQIDNLSKLNLCLKLSLFGMEKKFAKLIASVKLFTNKVTSERSVITGIVILFKEV